MMVSLDGFFEGPNHELDWHNVNDEFNRYAAELLNSADALLFGRRTYQMMAAYWPTKLAAENDPLVTEKMNNLPKYVFSKTLSSAEWENTKLVKENVEEEITALKKQPGKNIILMGSSNLALTFINYDLIDEYRIIVNPVVLGKGNPLFHGADTRIHLDLIRSKPMGSGNVINYYTSRPKTGT